MVIIDRNYYVIKQSEGTTWNFSYNKDNGIIYKFFKENTWSDHQVFSKEASKNFSVILLPDDSINVLYQDLTGTIILSRYNNQQWIEQIILTNEKKELFNIYFKTVVNEDKIQIIFSALNKENNTVTLFQQILDGKIDLSNSRVIDKIEYDYEIPFILYSSDNKELLIMYQRFVNNHEIGYKTFNNGKWSDFKLIDRSNYPFKDYSGIIFNEILHGLYIKKEDNIDSLNYIYDNKFTFKNKNLVQGSNIESCSIFIIYGQIWCFCIEGNKIYISFSINNGKNFSAPPYEQLINSADIFKTIYLSNEPEEKKAILGNEIYFFNDDKLKYLIFSTLYPNFKINNSYLSYLEYYMTEICLKVLSYEEQVLLYKRKFKETAKTYTKFIDLYNQLNENVNLFQENLTDNNKKIELLENIIKEKDQEIFSLKEKLKALESLNAKKEMEIIYLKKELYHIKLKFYFL